MRKLINRVDVLKKVGLFIPFLLYFCLLSLYPQEEKVTVIADKVPIYTEASENSIQIDLIEKGAVLTLFEPWEGEKTWLYVTYTSAKWSAKVTGFVQSSLVMPGELSPEEVVKEKTARPARKGTKIKEKKTTEVEIELDKLPSLKDVFKLKKKIEEFLPPALEFTVPESRRITAEEFKRKEVFPPVIKEAKEPEITPVQTKAIFVESDIPKQRNIAPTQTAESESRVFAIVKEDTPKLEIREEVVEAVTRAEKPEMGSQPFQVIVKKDTTTQIEMKEIKLPKSEEPSAEKEVKKAAKEAVKEEKGEKVIKAETPPKTPPTEEAFRKPKEKIQPKESPEKQEVGPIQQRKPPPELIKPKLPTRRLGLLTVGFGYGPSFGGFGAFFQLNSKAGFSIHAGAGYYPATVYYSDFDWLQNRILFSAGIKYYLPFGSDRLKPYLNLQYGGLSVEAVQVETGIWYGQKAYENIQKSLYGPSLLGGMEWRLGFLGVNGSLGLSYNTTDWEYWDRNLFLNGDIALIVYF